MAMALQKDVPEELSKGMSASLSFASTADSLSGDGDAPGAPKRVTGLEALKHVTITMEEVEKHKSKTDCWIVYEGMVLDMNQGYLAKHPGGKRSITAFSGKDCTEDYNKIHPHVKVEEQCPEAIIGALPKPEVRGTSLTTKLAVGIGLAAAAVLVMKVVKAKM
jgi:cytochrome b involved in lipid metabolism